ncbi:MAG: glycolate oxidase subunit GlcE [Pseudomonadota bacterium]
MSERHAPSSADELAALVRDSASARTPLELGGGYTRRGIGRAMQTASSVSLAKIEGITLYEPGALTLVAQAGTALSYIEATLDAQNQRLAFEPMDHRPLLGTSGEPTIGGVVAGNISGPRRVQAGACRDALLGVKFVDGRGAFVSNGGRVMKNVTGYDLTKLMCGSWGTLGALTEVALKVLPKPERAATLVVPSDDLGHAVRVMSAALGSPFEVTGAAYEPGRVLLRVEGLDGQVSYRLDRLEALLGSLAPAGMDRIDGTAHEAVWRDIRDVTAFAQSTAPVWKLALRPSEAPVVAAVVQSMTDAEVRLDWGGGLMWIALTGNHGTDAGEAIVRGAMADAGGHATLIRAPETVRASVPVFHPEPPRIADLSRQIRERFDPHGIFNPGRMAA